jgi:hypothetical protein
MIKDKSLSHLNHAERKEFSPSKTVNRVKSANKLT